MPLSRLGRCPKVYPTRVLHPVATFMHSQSLTKADFLEHCNPLRPSFALMSDLLSRWRWLLLSTSRCARPSFAARNGLERIVGRTGGFVVNKLTFGEDVLAFGWVILSPSGGQGSRCQDLDDSRGGELPMVDIRPF